MLHGYGAEAQALEVLFIIFTNSLKEYDHAGPTNRERFLDLPSLPMTDVQTRVAELGSYQAPELLECVKGSTSSY